MSLPECFLARVVIERASGRSEVVWLHAKGQPDMAAVDALARLRLVCQRAGHHMRLEEVSPALAELLELSGLRRELEGQAETGEKACCCRERGDHPLWLQERMDPGNPAP